MAVKQKSTEKQTETQTETQSVPHFAFSEEDMTLLINTLAKAPWQYVEGPITLIRTKAKMVNITLPKTIENESNKETSN